MNFHIENIIQQVKAWFPKAQAHIEAQAAELEARFNDQDFIDLPPEEVANYRDKITELPLPEAHKNAAKNKLSEVLKLWKIHESSADNHLFILADTVEPIRTILNQTIEEIDGDALPVKLLSWTARPEEYSTFQNQLESQLESSGDISAGDNGTTPESLVIIPDLSLCFLRCVEGLDGVEYLLDLILKDRSLFWLIGCNYWAWNYFNYLYKVNSCFEHILSLPSLNAVEIKRWLTPIYENLDIEFDINNSENTEEDAGEWQDEENNWISQKEKAYFERLTDISEGLSWPAAHLWLNSLRYVKREEKSDSTAEDISEEEPEKRLILKRATLPNLPKLTKEDQYLLSSIGLHGEINLSALAASLAESESVVRSQIPRLLRAGIIGVQEERFYLSPDYYPRVKRDLIDNQILAGEKD